MFNKKFSRYGRRITESRMMRAGIKRVLDEEMDNYEIRMHLIKALNELDKLSTAVTKGQLEEFVKPAFEKLLELKNELS